MSMRLAKNAVGPFDYYSEGTSLVPILAQGSLNGAGGAVELDTVSPVYAIFENDTGGIATIEGHPDNPAGPLVELLNEQVGVDWQISANGVDGWGNSLTLADQDVATGTKVVRVYGRCVVANDGSVAIGEYVQAQFRTKCNQSPV